MFIYKITNLISGKSYIGKTTESVNRRWKRHQYACATGLKLPLYEAMRKYDVQNFSIKVVLEVEKSGDLDQLEMLYIKKFSTKAPAGYNLTDGGDGASYGNKLRLNMHPSETNKVALRKVLIGNKFSQGHIQTETHKEKIRLALKGRKKPYLQGQPLSESTKSKLRTAQRLRRQKEADARPQTDTRRCTDCGDSFPLDSFYTRSGTDAKMSRCKVCHNKRTKKMHQ
jgi:group I intron endonuclease